MRLLLTLLFILASCGNKHDHSINDCPFPPPHAPIYRPDVDIYLMEKRRIQKDIDSLIKNQPLSSKRTSEVLHKIVEIRCVCPCPTDSTVKQAPQPQ